MILRHLTQRILAFRNNFAAKIRVMVVAERDNLIAVKTIISNYDFVKSVTNFANQQNLHLNAGFESFSI